MFRSVVLAALCVVLCSVNADARQRHRVQPPIPCAETVMVTCEMRERGLSREDVQEARRVARGQYIADQLGYGGVADRPVPKASKGRVSHYRGEPGNRSSGIVGTLAAKVSEIQSSCGSSVISGVRHTYIAGTRHISLHASGKAVDMSGSPGCIYAHLAGWSGGYSIDYARMGHVHISYDPDGGREMGLRFRHGGGHRYAHRHHHHRYASRRGGAA